MASWPMLVCPRARFNSFAGRVALAATESATGWRRAATSSAPHALSTIRENLPGENGDRPWACGGRCIVTSSWTWARKKTEGASA